MSELDRFTRFFEEVLGLELEKFQRRIVSEVFSQRREALILIPRGNGKSTLLAAIALWHLFSANEPRVAIGAASREQAAVLFDIARGMAASPLIAPRVEVTRREIRTPLGWLKVISSDGPKQHGLILSLAIVDELHAHRDAELYTALRTGLLKRKDARIVTISTAGSDDESALGELRRRALDQPKVRRKGAVTEATGPNLAMLEWALPESASIDDFTLVKTVNPASWLTEADLAEQREAVHEMAFRRYHCNQWVAGTDSAISGAEWAGCANPGVEIPVGAEGVVVGVDMALKWDTTAFVPVWKTEDGKTRAHTPTILTPPGDGTSLDFEEIFAAAEAIRERWPTCVFCLDPEAGGEILAMRIDRELGGSIMTHSQRINPMCRASQGLAELISTGGLEHPDDPGLNRHVLSAAARFYGVGFRFVKAKGSKLPIDACIALAMAVRVLAQEEATPTSTEASVANSQMTTARMNT